MKPVLTGGIQAGFWEHELESNEDYVLQSHNSKGKDPINQDNFLRLSLIEIVDTAFYKKAHNNLSQGR